MAPKKRSRAGDLSKKQIKAPEDSSDAKDPGDGRQRKRAASSRKSEKPRSSVSEKVVYTHWLMKSEPESRMENGVDVKFGIEDLKALPNQTGCWDGVRNYQATRAAPITVACLKQCLEALKDTHPMARNFMRDMKVGQQAFFYHSNCKEPGIAGIIKIVKEAYVDHTQFDKKDVHYDLSSKPENPKWSMVDVQFERMTKRFIPLSELKKYHLQHKGSGGALSNMALFTRARLSVQPLTAEEFDFVLGLEDGDPL